LAKWLDPELLNKSPLTPDEKEVLQRVSVQGEKLTTVAGGTKKKGGKSSLHKRALEHFSQWLQQELRTKTIELEKFQTANLELGRLGDRVGALENLVGLKGEYLGALKIVADAIGPSRMETCVHAVDGECRNLSIRVLDFKFCGICGHYSAKPSEAKASS